MRKLSVGVVLSLVLLAMLVAGPASAQDRGIVIAAGWAPSDVFGGDLGSSTFVPLGFMFNVGVPVAPKIHVVGDVSYGTKSGESVFIASGGARYVASQGKDKPAPFVEGLAGVASVTGLDTGYAFGFGGGVDVPVPNQPIAVRLQVNYMRVQISGGGFNAIRLGLGISLGTKTK